MAKTAILTIQQWGNSLVLPIPAGIARSAQFSRGQPVEVTLDESGITVRAVGEPRLSLAQKLARFDPAIHGGEAMASAPVGGETIPACGLAPLTAC